MVKLIFAAISRRQLRRKTERQLYDMDARTLKDIGISKDDIPRILASI